MFDNCVDHNIREYWINNYISSSLIAIKFIFLNNSKLYGVDYYNTVKNINLIITKLPYMSNHDRDDIRDIHGFLGNIMRDALHSS